MESLFAIKKPAPMIFFCGGNIPQTEQEAKKRYMDDMMARCKLGKMRFDINKFSIKKMKTCIPKKSGLATWGVVSFSYPEGEKNRVKHVVPFIVSTALQREQPRAAWMQTLVMSSKELVAGDPLSIWRFNIEC